MPETTNLVLGTAPRTINGCSDPRYQALNSGDRDTYRLAVTSPSVLVGSATRTGFADAFPVGFKVRIYLDDGPRLLGEGSGDRITFGPIALPAGSYALEIYDDVWVDSTYAYRISLQTLACPATNARTYTEAQDTASHRGNDVFQFDLNGFVFSETAASDVAEPSAGLALAPGEAIAIQGHSADVAPAGDSFRDRDTFQLAPSASVDLILLESAVTPATPPLLNANLWIQIVLNGTDARSTVTSAYWIFGAATKVWVGNLDSFTALSTDYTVRVCAFAVP